MSDARKHGYSNATRGVKSYLNSWCARAAELGSHRADRSRHPICARRHGVVGRYLAFAIPIYLRWRAGDSFTVGTWTLGRKYRWMAPLAVVEIAVTSLVAMFPTSAPGAPWTPGFAWKFVN